MVWGENVWVNISEFVYLPLFSDLPDPKSYEEKDYNKVWSWRPASSGHHLHHLVSTGALLICQHSVPEERPIWGIDHNHSWRVPAAIQDDCTTGEHTRTDWGRIQ